MLAQASAFGAVEFLGSSLLHWIDANEFARSTFVLKLHDAVDQSEERIVFPTADVVAGFPTSTALTGDECFHPERVRRQISSVPNAEIVSRDRFEMSRLLFYVP